jgi:hypothetical protein
VEREACEQTDKQADKGKDRLEYYDSFQVINKNIKEKIVYFQIQRKFIKNTA